MTITGTLRLPFPPGPSYWLTPQYIRHLCGDDDELEDVPIEVGGL
jgi:hypothetical protein